MSYFLAVSAFRSSSPQMVAHHIIAFAERFKVGVHRLEEAEAGASGSFRVFNPVDGWVVVLWPQHFNLHDFQLCQEVSERMRSVVSTIHVYDEAYWEHQLCDAGRIVHQFSSRPQYWAGEDLEIKRVEGFNSDPTVLCRLLQVDCEDLSRYLVDVDSLSSATFKVFPDDEFEIGNFWVFVDFWRRLGIVYPEVSGQSWSSFEFDANFSDKLPSL